MPYPSPITYPSRLLYPGTTEQEFSLSPIAIGDLLLNAIDDNGSRWIVKRFDGWGGPGSTAVFTQRARGHGSTASEAFYEHRLYEAIESRNPEGAHSEYNAMIRRLVSFAEAYESLGC